MAKLIIRLQTTFYRFAPLMQQKKNLFMVAALFWILLITIPMLVDVFGQGPPPSTGPPKVDIFAREVSNNAILVTWENPDDTADGIVFLYTVSRDVNRSEVFTEIFSSLRNIERKIIDENNGQEMFFFLDEDIIGGNEYTYQITAGRITGNPNPILSDDTRPILIQPFVEFVRSESYGHLIQGESLTPIVPIISWFDWLNPFQLAKAEIFSNAIFTTSLDPQTESYRLLLEPIPKPNATGDCSEVLEFEYSKNAELGQDFEIVTTIFEHQIHTDDDTGVEISTEVEIVRYQKTFNNFTDSDGLRQKWFVIHPEDQLIFDYSLLEIQFDITGKTTNRHDGSGNDPRSISFWQVLFQVPIGNNAC